MLVVGVWNRALRTERLNIRQAKSLDYARMLRHFATGRKCTVRVRSNTDAVSDLYQVVADRDQGELARETGIHVALTGSRPRKCGVPSVRGTAGFPDTILHPID